MNPRLFHRGDMSDLAIFLATEFAVAIFLIAIGVTA